jgi:hypothetical protein
MAQKIGDKAKSAAEEKLVEVLLDKYHKFTDSIKNGILPIGIAEVGKTTLLTKFDVVGPEVFLDFNRTLKTKTNSSRIREDLLNGDSKARFYNNIDVPGDLPEMWAAAYFDHNPRILIIMVDDRPVSEHLKQLNKFISFLKDGSSFWQKAKAAITFNWSNLSRIIFVINKSDLIEKGKLTELKNEYASFLADIHSELNVNIQTFTASLMADEKQLSGLLRAVCDGLGKK